ncbi:MAG: M48 family metalloprotease, partial [Halofilum sp. (in: g-proteobacteria)]|nr:M48 family metalloprotease [Halofilum sp. (in: g-proteobacteria)]
MQACRRLSAAMLIALAGTLAACATNPVTGEPDFVLMSEVEERRLGARYHKQILAEQRVYDDPELQSYVDRIGQRLARKSHRPELGYQFTVLDDDSVNAFALPGGYIYITRGIMAYFDSEAELAGVLGHEIGHVTARHSVRQYSTATATGILGSILLAEAGAGRAGQQLFDIVHTAAIRGYGREHELESDRLGAQYLARAGYDSQQMLEVVRILKDQELYEIHRAREEGREPRVYHGVFSTHPDNDTRLQEVIRAAKKFEVADARPPGEETYLRMIEGMPWGPSADQGVIDDHEFLHGPLDVALRAPRGWTIVNRPDRLIFEAPGGRAGVIATLDKAAVTDDPRKRLTDEVGELEQGRSLSVHGLDGYTGIAIGRTRAGADRTRYALIIKGEQAWYFRGLAPDNETFERLDDEFLDIIHSLHALT